MKIKSLEWFKSHMTGWNDDWHTIGPFIYITRCADENGWKWSSGGAHGYCSSGDEAKAAAQAHFEAAIRSALVEPEGVKVTTAEADVLRERSRQVTEEGWLAERDDRYLDGELARAAAAYCESAARPKLFARKPGAAFTVPLSWPPTWNRDWWKPTNPRRDLVKAGALIIAEIERLDRAILAAAKEMGE